MTTRIWNNHLPAKIQRNHLWILTCVQCPCVIVSNDRNRIHVIIHYIAYRLRGQPSSCSFRLVWLISHGWKYCWLIWYERKILFVSWKNTTYKPNKPKRTRRIVLECPKLKKKKKLRIFGHEPTFTMIISLAGAWCSLSASFVFSIIGQHVQNLFICFTATHQP